MGVVQKGAGSEYSAVALSCLTVMETLPNNSSSSTSRGKASARNGASVTQDLPPRTSWAGARNKCFKRAAKQHRVALP